MLTSTRPPLVRLLALPRRLITIPTITNDPYYTLGVSREATLREVKKAYFHKAKKYHPDLNPNNENAKKMFIEI
jgi:preprotein translocase subunit Sec63